MVILGETCSILNICCGTLSR